MSTPRTDLGTSPRVAESGRIRGRILRLILLAAVVVACSGGKPEPTDSTAADGVVVDVQGTLTEVQSFDLALPDGSRLTFVPEAGVLEGSGFSPSHLREHSALAQPISVRYIVVDGENRVTGIGDVAGG